VTGTSGPEAGTGTLVDVNDDKLRPVLVSEVSDLFGLSDGVMGRR